MSDAPLVMAIRDVGCLGAVKFVYRFAAPISRDIVDTFADCEIRLHEFSKTVRCASDLVHVRRHREFDADFVIGGRRAVSRFHGSAASLPQPAIDAFARRLVQAGLGRVVHAPGPRPRCDRCPAGATKKCAGAAAAHA